MAKIVARQIATIVTMSSQYWKDIVREVIGAADFSRQRRRPTPYFGHFSSERSAWFLRRSAIVQIQQNFSTRIRAEYLEMPGLRLTLAQAVRMWHTDVNACTAVLEDLVRDGFLCKRNASYLRADSGRHSA
jgi:hypothetical protein